MNCGEMQHVTTKRRFTKIQLLEISIFKSLNQNAYIFLRLLSRKTHKIMRCCSIYFQGTF